MYHPLFIFTYVCKTDCKKNSYKSNDMLSGTIFVNIKSENHSKYAYLLCLKQISFKCLVIICDK